MSSSLFKCQYTPFHLLPLLAVSAPVFQRVYFACVRNEGEGLEETESDREREGDVRVRKKKHPIQTTTTKKAATAADGSSHRPFLVRCDSHGPTHRSLMCLTSASPPGAACRHDASGSALSFSPSSAPRRCSPSASRSPARRCCCRCCCCA